MGREPNKRRVTGRTRRRGSPPGPTGPADSSAAGDAAGLRLPRRTAERLSPTYLHRPAGRCRESTGPAQRGPTADPRFRCGITMDPRSARSTRLPRPNRGSISRATCLVDPGDGHSRAGGHGRLDHGRPDGSWPACRPLPGDRAQAARICRRTRRGSAPDGASTRISRQSVCSLGSPGRAPEATRWPGEPFDPRTTSSTRFFAAASPSTRTTARSESWPGRSS